MSYLDRSEGKLLRPSRMPAVLWGALVPLIAGYGVLITLMSHNLLRGIGLSLLSFLPGMLVAFVAIALPVSLLFVLIMTGLAREWPALGSLAAWMVGGPVVSSPLATAFCWLFGMWGAAFVLALSLMGGVSAWLARPADLKTSRT